MLLRRTVTRMFSYQIRYINMSAIKCSQCGLVNWSTAPSCKRCGTTLIDSDSVVETRRSVSDTGYPKGILPWDAKPGDSVKPCLHCGNELGLKKWDSWNGFLVQCPHCGGLHGKRWNLRRIVLASFLFSGISFIFTMRPTRAAIALSVFVVLILSSYLLTNDQTPDLVEIGVGILILLGPLLVNAITFIKHESDLAESIPPAEVRRAYLNDLGDWVDTLMSDE
jgi:hypothetical protein